MSGANFFRKFKEDLGYTLADYVLKERIKLIQEYLLDRKNSITRVCFMAGFDNLNYFIRAFQKTVGLLRVPGNNSKTIDHKRAVFFHSNPSFFT